MWANTLKQQGGWLDDGNGTDDYGFSGLSVGFREEGDFIYHSVMTKWWSATEANNSLVYYRGLFYSTSEVSRYPDNKDSGNSVRCIKDE